MKKRGIINAQIAGLIAGLGHKDTFMIGDGGMPIPKGVEIVDLALCGGVVTVQGLTGHKKTDSVNWKT